MSELWTLLGQDVVADAVADALVLDDEIATIQGEPGSGKSFLAKQIGGVWENKGGTAIVALGDSLQADRDFYPLASSLAPLSDDFRKWAVALLTAATAGESLALGTGGKISATVRTLSSLRRRNRDARRLFLGEREQEILFDLERLSDGRPLLLIADNLHWWDRESLAFIGRLLEPRMREAFPFLARTRILGVQTPPPDQHVAHPDAHAALLKPNRTSYFDVMRPELEHFVEVLVGLGAPDDLGDEVYDSVFRLTGGHLALAARCATRLSEPETNRKRFLAQLDSGDFVERLLTERVASLGPMGQEAVQLLQTAAVLGLSFRRDEIACAIDGVEARVGSLLRYCRERDMLELDEYNCRFVHDLYRTHFLRSPDFDQVEVHVRLADCFRRLRPADYELRSDNALKAEQYLDAAVLALQAVVAGHQSGRHRRRLPAAVQAVLDESPLAEASRLLQSALRCVDISDANGALEALAGISHDLPLVVQAEADLVRASALMLTRSGADRARGLALLDSWSGLLSDEPDLRARLLRAQLYGRALEPDRSAALAVEDELRVLLRQRGTFDQSALDDLYTLDRCAAAVFEPDVAHEKVRQAVNHFRNEGVLRRPLDCYFSLMNMAAEHVVAGEYRSAIDVSLELEELVEDFEPGTFPKQDFALSNKLLAEFRLGTVDAAEAAKRQQAIIRRHTSDDDPFYPGNALAIFEAFAGDTAKAIGRYDSLLAQLAERREPETSMLYVLRANRCAVRFVAGDRDGVPEEWVELDSVVRRIVYPIASFYIRRHDLLFEVISGDAALTMQEFDVCLLERRPELGKQWEQLGRGFRLPEIMWWL